MRKLPCTCFHILLARLHILLIEFAFMNRVILVETLLYMHGPLYCDTLVKIGGIHGYALCGTSCARGGTQRLQVVLIGDGYIVERKYMHDSCHLHKLFMPLHST